MLLKRNMMALAMISAGLCFTAGVRAAQTDNSGTSAASATQTTTTQTTTTQTSATQSAADKKAADEKKKKEQQNSKASVQEKQLTTSLAAISVTGFSNSIEKSIDIQRYSNTIENVVSAADISGLPDQSIADALTRLPGVAAERIGGQASQINCRGLDGNFVLTTMNGREQPPTSGSNYTQFDVYPAELINQATVYKSSQASLIEGGVGCTIDMQTPNPLDNPKEQSLSIDARGSYNSQANDVTGANAQGYRFSAAWQGKFLNDTLGVGLGLAEEYQPHVSEQFVGEVFNSSESQLSPGGPSAYVPEGIQMQQNGGEERRDGYVSTIVWKPTDELQITGDGFFSRYDDQSYGYGLRSQNFYSASEITNPIISPSGALLGGTVSSTNPNNQFSNETTADNYTTVSHVFSGGLNLKWNHGPWHLDVDASMSRGYSNEINVDTTADPYNGLGTATPTLMSQSTTYALNGTNIGSASFANPGIYTNLNDEALSRYGVYPYVYTDTNKALRTSLKFDFLNNPLFSALEGGIYINNHDYDAQRSAWVYGSEFGGYASNTPTQPPLLLNSSDATVTCFKGSFASFPCFLKLNAPAILAANNVAQHAPVEDWNNNWMEIQSGTVGEKERDAYFMADIDTTLFDHPLTGNIGMRVAHTDQYSSGLQEVDNGEGVPIADGYGVVNNNYAPLNVGKTYTDYLPSMNLIYHWTDNDQTRFSVAKVLARPPINELLAGSGAWESNGQYNVWGGTSPLLDPLMARQYDLTYEHYFEDSSGLISADAFFKHIDSFVQNVTYNNFDFASAGITVPINPLTGVPYLNGEYQTSFNNTQGGYVRGMELAFSKTHFLPGIWSGLGVSANYAYTQSAVSNISVLGGAPQNQSLPGLSRIVASGAVYYDYGPFSTNVTVTHRSPWVSDSQVAVTNQLVYFNSETEIDFQSAYKINKNVSLLFQILNVNNAPTRTYFGNPSETGTIQYFGRTIYAGFNLSL